LAAIAPTSLISLTLIGADIQRAPLSIGRSPQTLRSRQEVSHYTQPTGDNWQPVPRLAAAPAQQRAGTAVVAAIEGPI